MSSSANKPIFRIKPGAKSVLSILEIWKYRDVLFILAGRDIQLRYKQTALGIIWVVLQPLLGAMIFTLVFGVFAKMPTGKTPYLLFVYSGLLLWNYFHGAASRASQSIVSETNLITKVYFPRIIIPLSSILSALVDLVVALLFMVILMIYFHAKPGLGLIWLLPFILLTTLLAAGVSFWISALSVYYRDFVYAAPFLFQVWMYATPIVYSMELIPERWKWLFALNPMVACVEGMRMSILRTEQMDWSNFAISFLGILTVFISGYFFFERFERTFADRL